MSQYEKKARRQAEADAFRKKKQMLYIQNGLVVLCVSLVFIFFGYRTISMKSDTYSETNYVDTSVVSSFSTEMESRIENGGWTVVQDMDADMDTDDTESGSGTENDTEEVADNEEE